MTGPPESARTGPDHQAGWTADAERYDQWFDQPWGAYAFTIERRALMDAAGNVGNRVVADVGCGTGRLTTHLDADGATVIALDADPDMLAVAARRTAACLLRADGQHLPLRTASVDIAIATTVCEFATDPRALIGELARITRPGGRVVVGALNRQSPWGIANRHQFGQPPWASARFLTRADLRRIGEPHGTVNLSAALYPPRALPFINVWGPALDYVGRLVAPGSGAFNVLTIDTHGQEHRP